jgi:altronate dehydratase
VLSDIPAGHKFAVRAIAAGQPVRKLNQIIGFATQPITVDEHVHTHIYGAEHLLTRRSSRPEVAERLIERIHRWEQYTARRRGSIDNNPQPGNKTGGLTTIIEKSLGAISKGGTTNLNQVFLYAQPDSGPAQEKGLVFMDSPDFDPVSATRQVAKGRQPPMLHHRPRFGIRLQTHPIPQARLQHRPLQPHGRRMDTNCGTIIDGDQTVEEVGAKDLRRDARRGLWQAHPKRGARLWRRGVPALSPECHFIAIPRSNSTSKRASDRRRV